MNVFSCNFYNLLFKGSLYSIYPLDSFQCCTVVLRYLGLLDLLHWVFLYFVLHLSYSTLPLGIIPTAPQPTSHMPPHLLLLNCSSLYHHPGHLLSPLLACLTVAKVQLHAAFCVQNTSHCCVISFPS